MSTYKRFEDLPVWQHSRKMANEIDTLVLNTRISKNFKLKDQMLGSSGSVMDNISEGFERGGNKEFVTFLFYAKGSAGELRSQLYRALDGKYISEEQFQNHKKIIESISSELQNFIEYLIRTDMKGYKFHWRENSDQSKS